MKKIHRFIIEYTIIDQLITIKNIELLHQWNSVLRFKPGEQIILANPSPSSKNNEALCIIKSLNKKEAILKIIEEKENIAEPKKKVTLYIAILKNENFELVVQKVSEIGVSEIVPMITDNTVKTGLKYTRLNKIAREAAELSGRSIVPIIQEAISFAEAIKKSTDAKQRIIFDISGKAISPPTPPLESRGGIAIFIGPEGGWSGNEIALANENNFTISSLGPLTLRAETAAIVASYLAINL